MSDPTPISTLAARATAQARLAALTAPDDGIDDEATPQALTGTDEAMLRRWHRAIPQRFHRATLGVYPPTVAADLAAWGDDPAGRNLVLFGPVGVGKTGAAIAACRAASDRRLAVRFAPTSDLLDLLRPGGPDDAMDALVDVDRLIVDDLGAERRTDWTDERLYVLLNGRWLEERPTVITSNLAPADLEAHVGARLFSRIVGCDAVTIRLSGPDRRRTR